jgi:signal transduction histidine kinase
VEKVDDKIGADIDTISRIPGIATILEVVCRTTGMGFAAVARVTEDQWVACAVRDEICFGLMPGGELKVETTICNEIRQSGRPVIIDHVAAHEHFSTHHTPAMYGFQSYISVPIILKDGSFFGTLCAIDPNPNQLDTPQVRGMFDLFADLISFHLHTMQQLAQVEAKLLEEQKTAELREQFIAILGHDLRNPVGAVLNSSQLMLRMPLPEQGLKLATIIQNSSYRIRGLIDNMLDFASGRLGGGVVLQKKDEQIQQVLSQVITELKMIWPDQNIFTDFNLTKPVNCDSKRIAQLFSNLLSNAISYGKAGSPVLVQAVCDGKEFSLSVINSGDKIPDKIMDRLFQPFSRGEVKRKQEGLGLGLYISAEIAHAHNGHLEVKSTEKETRFTFRMSCFGSASQ